MRTRLAITVALTTATICALTTSAAEAGSRKTDRPKVGGRVSVSASGNTVRYSRTRVAAKRTSSAPTNAGAVRCRRWKTSEVVGPKEDAPEEEQVLVVHYWRQCFSVSTGRATGPVREVGPLISASAGEEVWTAVVPDPVLLRENGSRFVTQRLSYVWLPAEYFRGLSVDLRSSSGQVLPNAAVARAVSVLVHPGWGSEDNTMDCTEDAQFPFDRRIDYWNQRSCGLQYMKSSVNEPGGAFTARVTVTWVVTAVIDGEGVDSATVVTRGSSQIRVEELQALVTCIGGSANACAH